MNNGGRVAGKRTARRLHRKERMDELVSDMDKVEKRLQVVQNPTDKKALESLMDVLYDSYCKVVNSEV